MTAAYQDVGGDRVARLDRRIDMGVRSGGLTRSKPGA
jgi:hypothetical protein